MATGENSWCGRSTVEISSICVRIAGLLLRVVAAITIDVLHDSRRALSSITQKARKKRRARAPRPVLAALWT